MTILQYILVGIVLVGIGAQTIWIVWDLIKKNRNKSRSK